MLNWRSKWLSVIRCTSHTIFCPPINCLSEPKNTRRSILGQTNSLSSSAPCLQSFDYASGLQDIILHGTARQRRSLLRQPHTHLIWQHRPKNKQRHQQLTKAMYKNMPWLFSRVPHFHLWDFLEQSRWPCIYQHSENLPSISGSSCFRFHASF